MLGDHPIDVILLATDLQASRDFYSRKIGLEVVREDDRAVEFKCGGNCLAITASSTGAGEEETIAAVNAFAEVIPSQASWRVPDLAGEVSALRSRGVEIMEYDLPGLKTEDGIVDLGFAYAAWFIDPGKNTIGVLQYK